VRLRFLDSRPRNGAPRLIGVWLVLLLFALPPAAAAALPSLILPLACTPDNDRRIANHVDPDPGPDVACDPGAACDPAARAVWYGVELW